MEQEKEMDIEEVKRQLAEALKFKQIAEEKVVKQQQEIDKLKTDNYIKFINTPQTTKQPEEEEDLTQKILKEYLK